jgi:hypothetical protein
MAAGALGDIVGVLAGTAGAEVAGGNEGLAGGNVWDRVGLGGNETDVDDLTDAADRDGPR